LTAAEGEWNERDRGRARPASEGWALPLSRLETAVLDACAAQREWPAQVAAGVYAGVDFAIANPVVIEILTLAESARTDSLRRYERFIGRLAGFIQINAPLDARRPGSTDEALVAGIVGLVGDHIRIGRVDRLVELRPDLVLLMLLPYLGFAEAQRWANEIGD